MKNRYMIDVKGLKCGKARVNDVNASFKDLGAVCDNIRGLPTEKAIELLGEFIKGTKPARYKKHNLRMAHRRELGGKKGRYPKKASKIVLGVLETAYKDAENKGVFNTYVKHAAANKMRNFPRLAPKGKSMMADYETAFVEVVLTEKN